MKRVLITGGSGKLGAWVLKEFAAHGYEVTNVDLRPMAGYRTYQADLTDLGQAFGMVEGHDAVVHLAAIPWPGANPPEVVYRNNVMSTFNVLQAACVLGVRKVITAGSESALGFPFRFRPYSPLYVPIDEAHPLLAQDAYGLSKITNEELGKGFARREPSMSIFSMRFSYVQEPEDYPSMLRRAWASPENNAFNLWAYIDARDAAVACRLAVELEHQGYEAVYIAAPDTVMREQTLDLIGQCYPGVERIAPGFGGRMSPLDCSHVQRLLGWKAEYLWENFINQEEIEVT